MYKAFTVILYSTCFNATAIPLHIYLNAEIISFGKSRENLTIFRFVLPLIIYFCHIT